MTQPPSREAPPSSPTGDCSSQRGDESSRPAVALAVRWALEPRPTDESTHVGDQGPDRRHAQGVVVVEVRQDRGQSLRQEGLPNPALGIQVIRATRICGFRGPLRARHGRTSWSAHRLMRRTQQPPTGTCASTDTRAVPRTSRGVSCM